MGGSILSGKTVLIVGSSRGIGAETARVAAREGAKVILHGNTESPHLLQLAKELSAEFVSFDIGSKEKSHQALNALLARIVKLDVLILSAGIAPPTSIFELDKEKNADVLDINLWGVIHCAQIVGAKMKEQGAGSIVTLSSIRATPEYATARSPLYAASKAGVEALTVSLAKTLAPAVRVNCVAPGFTLTEMQRHWNESAWAQARSNLLGRPAETSELAEVLVFIASDRASYINAAIIPVDGGYGASGK